jgi:hypothetical protein
VSCGSRLLPLLSPLVEVSCSHLDGAIEITGRGKIAPRYDA